MSEPIFSVLTGKAQSCDSNGNCYYCTALFLADRIFGTFTVTGAGSVTFTDPNDANNPYNGTFDINGTYTYNNGFWSKDNGRLVMENLNSYVAITIAFATDPGNLEWLWSAEAFGPHNSCGSLTMDGFTIENSGPENGYYTPGITLTGGAPTVVWNPDNTNRTICNNAGGVYAGMFHSYYPNGPMTGTTEECLMYTLVPEADGGGTEGPCVAPSSPGGSYTLLSLSNHAGQYQSDVGHCCSGDCFTPFTDCTGWNESAEWFSGCP